MRTGGNPVKSPTDELYVVAGRILGGSGVASIKAGKGFSLTYVSTGLYRITPDVNFPSVEGGSAMIMSATDVAYQVNVKAYTLPGAGGHVDLEVTSGGTATDLGASDEVWFTLAFCRSVKP